MTGGWAARAGVEVGVWRGGRPHPRSEHLPCSAPSTEGEQAEGPVGRAGLL